MNDKAALFFVFLNVNDTVMDILTEKIRLAKMLLETENLGIIQSISKIFERETTADFWDDLSPLEKKEIEKGSEEIKRGDISDYDDYMKRHR